MFSQNKHKIALLGANFSGKSTIIKQLKLIHSKEYSLSNIRTNKFYKNVILNENLIPQMLSLITQLTTARVKNNRLNTSIVELQKLLIYGYLREEQEMHSFSMPAVLKHTIFLFTIHESEVPFHLNSFSILLNDNQTAEKWKLLKELWNDRFIQLSFNNQSTVGMALNLKYFLNECNSNSAISLNSNSNRNESISKCDLMFDANTEYILSNDDFLHQQTSTSGIFETQLQVSFSNWTLIDVSGRKDQRVTWFNSTINVCLFAFFHFLIYE